MGQIERDLDVARDHAAAIRLSPGKAVPATLEALASHRDLLRVLARARVRLGLVREHVAEGGPLPASLDDRETSLRARTDVVVDQLEVLKDLGEQLTESGLLAGTIGDLGAVLALLSDGIGRANARWRQALRRVAERKDLGDARERARLYRSALDQAERAFDRIGRHRDLVRVLQAGAVSANKAIRTACREIAAMVRAELPPSPVSASEPG